MAQLSDFPADAFKYFISWPTVNFLYIRLGYMTKSIGIFCARLSHHGQEAQMLEFLIDKLIP